jgi:hypothetical protein
MPSGAVRTVAQRERDGIALPDPDHWAGHLAVVGHVVEFGAGFDLGFDLESFERDFVMH